MPKFRKKPVVIEARQFDGKWGKLASWCNGEFFEFSNKSPYIIISTLEGKMKVSLGDWIIEGISGEFYPCKPDIFEKTYEAVD